MIRKYFAHQVEVFWMPFVAKVDKQEVFATRSRPMDVFQGDGKATAPSLALRETTPLWR